MSPLTDAKAHNAVAAPPDCSLATASAECKSPTLVPPFGGPMMEGSAEMRPGLPMGCRADDPRSAKRATAAMDDRRATAG